jgi:hypothetical protein
VATWWFLNFPLLAKANGFHLKANVGAMSGPPRWFLATHPDAQLTNETGLKSDNVISYWYPSLRSLLEEKDDQIFALLSQNGLLDALSYIVIPLGPAGEPIYPASWTTSSPHAPARFWFYDTYARSDFLVKMRAKYQQIGAANWIWRTSYGDWNSVTIPEPGTQPGPMWSDVLTWYRDVKRSFVAWQIAHYQRLLAKYYPDGGAPRLIILVPGNHISPYEWAEAVKSGGGNSSIVIMVDSEFLLDTAHRTGALLQYTGLPNMVEVEYLQSYMRGKGYNIPMWGENAGNKGVPDELGYEVLANGLYGQEYVGSNLFDADQLTPMSQLSALSRDYSWLEGVWTGRVRPILGFDSLTIIQGGCVYADAGQRSRLCLEMNGVLALYQNETTLWSSGADEGEDFCSITRGPAFECKAVFQEDGNFVVYRGAKVLWASGTHGRGKKLLFSDEKGFLEIVDERGEVVWQSSLR